MEPIEWIYFIVVILLAVYAYTKRPKPQKLQPQESMAPTTADGTKIIKWFGTNWMDDSVVTAWKRDGTEPIKQKSGK